MESIYLDNKEFKPIKNTKEKYFISKDGEVFSMYSKKIIKTLERTWDGKTYKYVDINYGEGQKHRVIHRLVFEAWVRDLNDNEQVNHIDDNTTNNSVENLYAGSQKENIKDCINNQHRVGNVWYLTILDKKNNKTLSFCPASEFIKYCRHSNKSGSVKKYFKKNWFKMRYEVLDFRRIKNLDSLKSVTTMGDECNPVG